MSRPDWFWTVEHISPPTDNCRGLRFLPVSPTPSQICTTCIRHARLQRTSGQPAAKETVSLCVQCYFDGGGLAGAGRAGGAGVSNGAGLLKRESSIRGSISIFSAVRVCLISVPGLPWSIRNGYFRPWTSWKSEKKDSQGISCSPVLWMPCHFKSKKVEASKK